MKRWLIFFACIPCLTFSQIKVDTMFTEIVEGKENFNIRLLPDSSSERFIYEKYTLDNVLVERTFFFSENATVSAKDFENLRKKKEIYPDGLQTTFDNRTGAKMTERLYQKGKEKKGLRFYPDGAINSVYESADDSFVVDEYYESGQLKRHEEYNKEVEVTLKKHYTPDGRDTVFNEVYTAIPKFPGGSKALAEYIRANLKYPPGAVKKRIEGVVTVRFVVEEDGTIAQVSVEKSVCFDCADLNEEAVRMSRKCRNGFPASGTVNR